MGFLSSLFGSSKEDLDAFNFIKLSTSFEPNLALRNQVLIEGKMFAYQIDPINNPSPEYIKPSAQTLAGELIYLMNFYEEQGDRHAMVNLKTAMKNYLLKYESSCPAAYSSFMSSAYSSN